MRTQTSASCSSLHQRDCHAITRFAADLPDPALEFTQDEDGAVLAMFRFAGTDLCVWREQGAVVIGDLAGPALVRGARSAGHALASLRRHCAAPAARH